MILELSRELVVVNYATVMRGTTWHGMHGIKADIFTVCSLRVCVCAHHDHRRFILCQVVPKVKNPMKSKACIISDILCQRQKSGAGTALSCASRQKSERLIGGFPVVTQANARVKVQSCARRVVGTGWIRPRSCARTAWLAALDARESG